MVLALDQDTVAWMAIAGIILVVFILASVLLWLDGHPKRDEGLDAPISAKALRRIIEQDRSGRPPQPHEPTRNRKDTDQ